MIQGPAAPLSLKVVDDCVDNANWNEQLVVVRGEVDFCASLREPETESRQNMNRVHVDLFPSLKLIDCDGVNNTPVEEDCDDVGGEGKLVQNVKADKLSMLRLNIRNRRENDCQDNVKKGEQHSPVGHKSHERS